MLNTIKLPGNELVALLIAISFAAGLNLYATVATLGLLARAGALPLPPPLQLLQNWYVIAAAAVLFLVEFFADGLIALAAHGGKTAVRAAVTPSPEPLSNFTLSMGEDALAIFLTWFASKHPFLAAAVVAWLLIVTITVTRWIIRAMRALFRGAEQAVAK